MKKMSGDTYLENETKLFGPIINRVHRILGKSPDYEQIMESVLKRRQQVRNIL